MRSFQVALAGLLLTGAAPAHRVTDFSWLAGVWFTEEETGWTEERWAPPRGGVMLGTSLSGRGDRADGYEFMRLAADREGTIAFWASPNGRTPVRFPLVSSSSAGATFENPDTDYPTRIVYRREGNELIATISGRGGRNPKVWRFARER